MVHLKGCSQILFKLRKYIFFLNFSEYAFSGFHEVIEKIWKKSHETAF